MSRQPWLGPLRRLSRACEAATARLEEQGAAPEDCVRALEEIFPAPSVAISSFSDETRASDNELIGLEGSAASWAEDVAELRLASSGTRLLDLLLTRAEAALQHGSLDEQRRKLLVYGVLFGLIGAMRAPLRVLQACTYAHGLATASTPQRIAPLLAELGSPSCLLAFTKAVRFVSTHVEGWAPTAAAPMDEYSAAAKGAALLGNAATLPAGLLAARAPRNPHLEQLRAAAASGALGGPLAHEDRLGSRSGEPPAPRPDAAEVDAARRLLAALNAAGLVPALAAALLSAPSCAPLAPAASRLPAYTQSVYEALDRLFVTISRLSVYPPACHSAIIDLLAAPDVVRLRIEGLRQLAASRGIGGGAASACSAAERAAVEARCWPLLRRDVRRLAGPSLTDVYVDLIRAAVHGAGDASCSGAPLAPAVVAAAARVLPGRRQAAALLASACRALAEELEDPRDPQAEVAHHAQVERPLQLAYSAGNALTTLEVRMHGAPTAEAAACVPDLLAAHAWALRCYASQAAFAGMRFSFMATLMRVVDYLLHSVECFPGMGAVGDAREVWEFIGPAGQAACARQLAPTRLLCSLDACFRRVAANCDTPGDGPHSLALAVRGAAAIVPLGYAAMLQAPELWRRHQPGREVGALGGGDGGGKAGWRMAEELGVVVTAAKLARREATRLATGAGGADGTPDLFQPKYCAYLELAQMLIDVGCDPRGLPLLLKELEAVRGRAQAAAAPGGGGGSSAAEGAATAAATAAAGDCQAVAEAIALCGCSAVQLLAALNDHAASAARSGVRGVPGGADTLAQALERASAAASGSILILNHMTPAVAAAAAPQRWLASLARLLVAAGPGALRPSAFLGPSPLAMIQTAIIACTARLASNEGLQAACVPGWLWAESPSAQGDGEPAAINFRNLAAVAAAGGAPPGPVVVLRIQEAAALLRGRTWEEHGQCTAAVVAVARLALRLVGDSGNRRVAEAVKAMARYGPALVPPRALKLCGNPSCGNFEATSEAGLKLKRCGGCGVLRYCGAACSRQHWRVHKEECKQLAAASERGAAGDSGVQAGAAAGSPASATGSASDAGGVHGGAPRSWSREELLALRPRELRALLAERGVDTAGCLEKEDFVRRLLDAGC